MAKRTVIVLSADPGYIDAEGHLVLDPRRLPQDERYLLDKVPMGAMVLGVKRSDGKFELVIIETDPEAKA